jgi:hypothetical protein
MKKPMNLGAMKTNKMENPWTDGPFIRPAADAVAPVEPEDLSRFEGEGGPEGPESATELIDVPLEKAIWRRSPWPADQMNRTKMTI